MAIEIAKLRVPETMPDAFWLLHTLLPLLEFQRLAEGYYLEELNSLVQPGSKLELVVTDKGMGLLRLKQQPSISFDTSSRSQSTSIVMKRQPDQLLVSSEAVVALVILLDGVLRITTTFPDKAYAVLAIIRFVS